MRRGSKLSLRWPIFEHWPSLVNLHLRQCANKVSCGATMSWLGHWRAGKAGLGCSVHVLLNGLRPLIPPLLHCPPQPCLPGCQRIWSSHAKNHTGSCGRGALRSEIKEEDQAQPDPGDIRGAECLDRRIPPQASPCVS